MLADLKATFIRCVQESSNINPVLTAIKDEFGRTVKQKKEFLKHLVDSADVQANLTVYDRPVSSFPKKADLMRFIKSPSFWEQLQTFDGDNVGGTTAMAFLVAVHIDGRKGGSATKSLMMEALYLKFVPDKIPASAEIADVIQPLATPPQVGTCPKRPSAQDYKELAFNLRLLKRKCEELDKDMARMGQCAIAALPAIKTMPHGLTITDGSMMDELPMM